MIHDDNVFIGAICRDGIGARIQKVPYAGKSGEFVFCGSRAAGEKNEGPDIWTLAGAWAYDGRPHPFDLLQVNKSDVIKAGLYI